MRVLLTICSLLLAGSVWACSGKKSADAESTPKNNVQKSMEHKNVACPPCSGKQQEKKLEILKTKKTKKVAFACPMCD